MANAANAKITLKFHKMVKHVKKLHAVIHRKLIEMGHVRIVISIRELKKI